MEIGQCDRQKIKWYNFKGSGDCMPCAKHHLMWWAQRDKNNISVLPHTPHSQRMKERTQKTKTDVEYNLPLRDLPIILLFLIWFISNSINRLIVLPYNDLCRIIALTALHLSAMNAPVHRIRDSDDIFFIRNCYLFRVVMQTEANCMRFC